MDKQDAAFVRWLNHVLENGDNTLLASTAAAPSAKPSLAESLRGLSVRRREARLRLLAARVYESADVQAALHNGVDVCLCLPVCLCVCSDCACGAGDCSGPADLPP